MTRIDRASGIDQGIDVDQGIVMDPETVPRTVVVAEAGIEIIETGETTLVTVSENVATILLTPDDAADKMTAGAAGTVRSRR